MSTTPSTNTVPVHQRPDSCHVCGRPEAEHAHPSGDTRRGYGQIGHTFWSNADAMAEAREHDRRTTFVYSNGATTPEAAFVEAYVPEASSS